MGKLVRDKIPQILEAKGEKHVTHELSDSEYLFALGRKVVKEAWEVFEAVEIQYAEGILEELADIQEVALALLAAIGKTPEDLEDVRLQKLEEHGGFAGRIFLEEIIENSTI